MTEIWFRNGQQSLAVLAQEAVTRLTFTRMSLHNRGHDGLHLVRQYYMSTPVRPIIRLIGIQGTAEYDIFRTLDNPIAVYPTFSGQKDSWADLMKMIENPAGEDERACCDMKVEKSLRPVWGQKHRIIITNAAVMKVGRQFYRELSLVQEAFPEVELFINGSSSPSILFGMGFKSVDFGMNDPGEIQNFLYLPNGKKIELVWNKATQRYEYKDSEKAKVWESWVKTMGLDVKTLLDDTDERMRLKIRSAKWAAAHWSANYRFITATERGTEPDYQSPDTEFIPPENRRITLRQKKHTNPEADNYLCASCTLAPACKFYREESICSVPGESKVADLAKFFQTRDSSTILEGLAAITRLQADRLEEAIEAEADAGVQNPAVGKQMNELFANGVRLAKLVNPSLSGPAVQVNVGVQGNAQVVAQSNPKAVIANVVRELEQSGIPRERQTPDMIEAMLKSMSIQTVSQAAEAQAVAIESTGSSALPPPKDAERIKVIDGTAEELGFQG